MIFDRTISLGHILTFVAGMLAVLGVYVAFTQQLGAVDYRTRDYPIVRDMVLADDGRISTLSAAIASQSASTASISIALSNIREDLAGIKATLAIRNGPGQ